MAWHIARLAWATVGELDDIDLTHPYPVADFVEVLLAELRAGGAAAARFDDGGFLVALTDGAGAVRHLLMDRLYLELQHVPDAARADRIAAGVAAALRPLPATWPEVQPLLRALLRPAGYTAAVTDDANRPWIRPLWPFVNELVVVDSGDARTVVTQRDTAAWGVRGGQLFAAARDNIAARYPPQPQPQQVGHLRGDGHSYCDSAVMVPGWLSAFAVPDGPQPGVFFPGDEVLLVCSDDPGVAPEFFAAAERLYRQAAVPVSPQGYTIVGDTIVALDAVGPGPVRSLAVRARAVLADAEYLTQTDRLQRYFAEQQLGTQPGSVQLIETPRGSCTMTVWSDGADLLLPHADYLTFLSADAADYFTVPFPVAADIVGLVRDPGLVPARYPVTAWPDAAALAVLRAHAVVLPGI